MFCIDLGINRNSESNNSYLVVLITDTESVFCAYEPEGLNMI